MIDHGTFQRIISLPNLYKAWQIFRRGKCSKADVKKFAFFLEDNLFDLHQELKGGQYKSGGYSQFVITDPKRRVISKPSVKDRVLHQAIYQNIYPLIDPTFIFDSYSCRNEKGTHKAFQRLVQMTKKVSQNYTKPCWAIKMDVRKFFNSVDHDILVRLLSHLISDRELLALTEKIIRGFEFSPGKGMPLGNLTSQLLANIYLDPLDRFVKYQLKVNNYLRYADDFLILSTNPEYLLSCLVEIDGFLKDVLELNIHPDKIYRRNLNQGIDFVGYIVRRYCQLPRHKTLKRIERQAAQLCIDQLKKSLPSYLGHLSHVNAHKASQKLLKLAKPASKKIG